MLTMLTLCNYRGCPLVTAHARTRLGGERKGGWLGMEAGFEKQVHRHTYGPIPAVSGYRCTRTDVRWVGDIQRLRDKKTHFIASTFAGTSTHTLLYSTMNDRQDSTPDLEGPSDDTDSGDAGDTDSTESTD